MNSLNLPIHTSLFLLKLANNIDLPNYLWLLIRYMYICKQALVLYLIIYLTLLIFIEILRHQLIRLYFYRGFWWIQWSLSEMKFYYLINFACKLEAIWLNDVNFVESVWILYQIPCHILPQRWRPNQINFIFCCELELSSWAPSSNILTKSICKNNKKFD